MKKSYRTISKIDKYGEVHYFPQCFIGWWKIGIWSYLRDNFFSKEIILFIGDKELIRFDTLDASCNFINNNRERDRKIAEDIIKNKHLLNQIFTCD